MNISLKSFPFPSNPRKIGRKQYERMKEIDNHSHSQYISFFFLFFFINLSKQIISSHLFYFSFLSSLFLRSKWIVYLHFPRFHFENLDGNVYNSSFMFKLYKFNYCKKFSSVVMHALIGVLIPVVCNKFITVS